MTYKNDDDYKRDIRAEHPPTHPSAASTRPYPPTHTRRPGRFWIFVLSPLPGLSHMYLGLIRRGLFYISALALLVFLTTALAPSILVVLTGFSTAALFAVAFFEAFAIRRDIVMGKEVKDSIPNIAFILKNKTLLTVTLIIVAIAIGINIIASLPWYAWMIMGIVAVVYFFTKTTK